MPIAAVVPAYNAERFIAETLASLCRQTMALSEIVVVDDGSTDATASIVSDLASRFPNIRLERFSHRHGPAAARNYALSVTTAQMLLFMDADDIAEPNLVEKEWHKLQEIKLWHPGPWLLCHSAYRIIDSTGTEAAPVVRWKQVLPEETLGYQFVRNFVSTSGVLVRREAVIVAGGFDVALRYSEDAELWLRLAAQGGFAYVDEPLVRVRRHPGNASRRLATMLDAEREILARYPVEVIERAIRKRHLPWWDNTSEYVSVLYRLARWEEGYAVIRDVVERKPDYPRGYFLLGLYYLHAGDYQEAAPCFDRALQLAPNHGAALNNLGALLALRGKKNEAAELLDRALALFPGYLDAGHNVRHLHLLQSNPSLVRFTWRELRPVLTQYQE